MAMNPCLSACTSWPGSTLWPNTSTGSPHLDKSNFDNSFGIAVGLLLLVSCLWLNISTWLARSGRVQRKADVQLLWNPHQSSHPRLCWSNVRGWTKSKTFMENKFCHIIQFSEENQWRHFWWMIFGGTWLHHQWLCQHSQVPCEQNCSPTNKNLNTAKILLLQFLVRIMIFQ